MRIGIPFIAAFAAIALAVAGCSKEGGPGIDTTAVQKSFAPAEAALKAASAKAVDAVKKGDYSGALKELQLLAGDIKLTDEQKKAINDLIEQVKRALADAGNKALGEAQKALGK